MSVAPRYDFEMRVASPFVENGGQFLRPVVGLDQTRTRIVCVGWGHSNCVRCGEDTKSLRGGGAGLK